MGNFRLLSLTSIPGKLLEPVIKYLIYEYLKDERMITGPSMDLLRKKTCDTNQISCSHRITCLVDKGTIVNIIYFNFSKTFHKVPHAIVISKVDKSILDRYIID